ncbi:MAG TPA: hypothetical protein PLW93_01580 [Candidatus Absconditabacterales bacterium]|nr:hypothetical protein [Candidatus Absconditabacterales bacterium]HNG96944.1 hypothetical protein [Candidatus Absconditabacterales bacterium]
MSVLGMDFSYKPSNIINRGKDLVGNFKDEIKSAFVDTKNTVNNTIKNGYEGTKNILGGLLNTGTTWFQNRIKSIRNIIGNAIEGGTSLVPIINGFGKKIGDILRTDAPKVQSAPTTKKPDTHH